MNEMSNTAVLKEQYSNADNLNTRISIHKKYSTNKTGFGNWILSNYKIEKGMTVLELGCGTGDMWKGHDEIINACSKLILSDFSRGMVETAKANLNQYDNIEYMIIDIQAIPFEAESFDVVIANMMLYHVPDLKKGLSEVRRVLKPGGQFYCATYGEHGIVEYISDLLRPYGAEDKTNKNFTLQNGRGLLGSIFQQVDQLEYEDSLRVTDIDDLVEYIYSLSSMTALNNLPKEEVRQVLARNMTDGVLEVPKEYGMFIAYSPARCPRESYPQHRSSLI